LLTFDCQIGHNSSFLGESFFSNCFKNRATAAALFSAVAVAAFYHLSGLLKETMGAAARGRLIALLSTV